MFKVTDQPDLKKNKLEGCRIIKGQERRAGLLVE